MRRAKDEDKPIFLSVGYSACHWCHVMEHESFEDEKIAAALNEKFVCIKVDREERPDIDQIYMNAVQLMTGRGGWPMSVFLTPDLKPFYAGTYFPPRRSGRSFAIAVAGAVVVLRPVRRWHCRVRRIGRPRGHLCPRWFLLPRWRKVEIKRWHGGGS